NEYRLVETAKQYVDATKRFANEKTIVHEKIQKMQTLENDIEQLTNKNHTLEQQAEVMDKKQSRLIQHKVWRLEEERTSEVNRLTETIKNFERKDQQVTHKTKLEFQIKGRIQELQGEISTLEDK